METLDLLRARKTCPLIDQALDAELELRSMAEEVSRDIYAAIPKTEGTLRGRLLEAKRLCFKAQDPLPDLSAELARSGLAELGALLARYNAMQNERLRLMEKAASAFEGELDEAFLRVIKLFDDSFIAEGVLLESEALFRASRRLASAPARPRTKALRHFIRSMTKFLTRWCARPTPRSIVTAVTIGRVREENGVKSTELSSEPILKNRTVLVDSACRTLAIRASALAQNWRRVRPRINPTLSAAGPDMVSWMRQVTDDAKVSDELCRLPVTELLEPFLRLARPRELTAEQLIESVHREIEGELSLEALETYYKTLCETHILLGSLELPFNEPEKLSFVRRWLEDAPEPGNGFLLQIKEIEGEIEQLNKTINGPFEGKEKRYRKIDALLQACAGIEPAGPAHLLAVDSEAKWRDEMGPDVLQELGQALAVLARIGDALKDRKDSAKSIGERLLAMCAKDTEIPVMSLWNKGASPLPSNPPPPPNSNQTEARRRLNLWLKGAVAGGNIEIRLTSGELESALGPPPQTAPLENNAAVFFSVFSESARAFAQGDYAIEIMGMLKNFAFAYSRWLGLLSGPKPIADHAAFHAVKHVYEKTQQTQPDKTLAGILFAAGSVADQVAWQPNYHAYEIECDLNVRSSLPGDRVIPVSELYFHVEQDSKQAALYWHRGKERIPILARHDGLLIPKLYPWVSLATMLSSAQIPFDVETFFDRIEISAGIRWLPRIRAGKVIIRKQAWYVDRERIPGLKPDNEWETFLDMRRWHKAMKLPRYVRACVRRFREELLLVDFESPAMVDALASTVRNNPTEKEIIFFEEPALEGHLPHQSDRGRYAAQAVAGFYWETGRGGQRPSGT